MGLYLVNQVVESYGGDVWATDVDSDNSPSGATTALDQDTGAVFVVELSPSTNTD